MSTFRFDEPSKVTSGPKGSKVLEYEISGFPAMLTAAEIRRWENPVAVYAPIPVGASCECDHIIDFEKILRQTYYRRLESFLNLKTDWDGANAAPLQPISFNNSKVIFDRLSTAILSKWEISPAANGTLMLSLKNRAIGAVNIGDRETSYVAIDNNGSVITQGQEKFDSEKTADILSQIAEKLSNGPVRI